MKARKTPTVEQKAWMKENGYTVAQMDAFWEENADTNVVIKACKSAGKTWRDMGGEQQLVNSPRSRKDT